jgi:hypothetical protein
MYVMIGSSCLLCRESRCFTIIRIHMWRQIVGYAVQGWGQRIEISDRFLVFIHRPTNASKVAYPLIYFLEFQPKSQTPCFSQKRPTKFNSGINQRRNNHVSEQTSRRPTRPEVDAITTLIAMQRFSWGLNRCWRGPKPPRRRLTKLSVLRQHFMFW